MKTKKPKFVKSDQLLANWMIEQKAAQFHVWNRKGVKLGYFTSFQMACLSCFFLELFFQVKALLKDPHSAFNIDQVEELVRAIEYYKPEEIL